jgi:hypothetical protein
MLRTADGCTETPASLEAGSRRERAADLPSSLATTTHSPPIHQPNLSGMLALPSLVALATAFSSLAAATPISTFADAAAAAGHPHGKAAAAPALAPIVAHAVDQGKEAIKDSYSQSLPLSLSLCG